MLGILCLLSNVILVILILTEMRAYESFNETDATKSNSYGKIQKVSLEEASSKLLATASKHKRTHMNSFFLVNATVSKIEYMKEKGTEYSLVTLSQMTYDVKGEWEQLMLLLDNGFVNSVSLDFNDLDFYVFDEYKKKTTASGKNEQRVELKLGMLSPSTMHSLETIGPTSIFVFSWTEI